MNKIDRNIFLVLFFTNFQLYAPKNLNTNPSVCKINLSPFFQYKCILCSYCNEAIYAANKSDTTVLTNFKRHQKNKHPKSQINPTSLYKVTIEKKMQGRVAKQALYDEVSAHGLKAVASL